MTFTIKRKFGFKHLVHESTYKNYGLFIGNLNLHELNNIYKILEKECDGVDYDDLEKQLRGTIDNILDSDHLNLEDKCFVQEYISILDNPYAKEFSLHKYYLKQLAATSLCVYCLNTLRDNLPRIWFKNFIPVINVTQMTNNPYSKKHPLYDPKVDWKVEIDGLVYRTWSTLFNRYLMEYKFI